MDRSADEVIEAVSTPPQARREWFVWNGLKIQRRFAQTPRIHRVEPSQPRGSSVGDRG